MPCRKSRLVPRGRAVNYLLAAGPAPCTLSFSGTYLFALEARVWGSAASFVEFIAVVATRGDFAPWGTHGNVWEHLECSWH